MEHNDAQYIGMTQRPIGRLITSLAVPTIISMLVTSIYNMADTFFVSRIGTSASAAVRIVFSLMAIIQAAGFTIGMGSGSWISRLLGMHKTDEANKVASSGFFMSTFLGILLAMIGIATGGILNCGLDPLFIFTFRMGIAGAAVATALSQLVSFIILLAVFLNGSDSRAFPPSR